MRASIINRRLLEVERVSHNCGLSADSIQRVVQLGQKTVSARTTNRAVVGIFVGNFVEASDVNKVCDKGRPDAGTLNTNGRRRGPLRGAVHGEQTPAVARESGP